MCIVLVAVLVDFIHSVHTYDENEEVQANIAIECRVILEFIETVCYSCLIACLLALSLALTLRRCVHAITSCQTKCGIAVRLAFGVTFIRTCGLKFHIVNISTVAMKKYMLDASNILKTANVPWTHTAHVTDVCFFPPHSRTQPEPDGDKYTIA